MGLAGRLKKQRFKVARPSQPMPIFAKGLLLLLVVFLMATTGLYGYFSTNVPACQAGMSLYYGKCYANSSFVNGVPNTVGSDPWVNIWDGLLNSTHNGITCDTLTGGSYKCINAGLTTDGFLTSNPNLSFSSVILSEGTSIDLSQAVHRALAFPEMMVPSNLYKGESFGWFLTYNDTIPQFSQNTYQTATDFRYSGTGGTLLSSPFNTLVADNFLTPASGFQALPGSRSETLVSNSGMIGFLANGAAGGIIDSASSSNNAVGGPFQDSQQNGVLIRDVNGNLLYADYPAPPATPPNTITFRTSSAFGGLVSTTPIASTLTVNGVGDLLVVSFFCTGNCFNLITSVTDSFSDPFVIVSGGCNDTNMCLQYAYGWTTNSGSDTVNVAWTTGGGVTSDVSVSDFSGVGDVFSLTNNSGTCPASGTCTLSANGNPSTNSWSLESDFVKGTCPTGLTPASGQTVNQSNCATPWSYETARKGPLTTGSQNFQATCPSGNCASNPWVEQVLELYSAPNSPLQLYISSDEGFMWAPFTVLSQYSTDVRCQPQTKGTQNPQAYAMNIHNGVLTVGFACDNTLTGAKDWTVARYAVTYSGGTINSVARTFTNTFVAPECNGGVCMAVTNIFAVDHVADGPPRVVVATQDIFTGDEYVVVVSQTAATYTDLGGNANQQTHPSYWCTTASCTNTFNAINPFQEVWVFDPHSEDVYLVGTGCQEKGVGGCINGLYSQRFQFFPGNVWIDGGVNAIVQQNASEISGCCGYDVYANGFYLAWQKTETQTGVLQETGNVWTEISTTDGFRRASASAQPDQQFVLATPVNGIISYANSQGGNGGSGPANWIPIAVAAGTKVALIWRCGLQAPPHDCNAPGAAGGGNDYYIETWNGSVWSSVSRVASPQVELPVSGFGNTFNPPTCDSSTGTAVCTLSLQSQEPVIGGDCFALPAGVSVTQVTFYVTKAGGTGTGTIVAKIYSTIGTKAQNPTPGTGCVGQGTLIATSTNTFSIAGLSTNATPQLTDAQAFNFNPVAMPSGNNFVVLEADFTQIGRQPINWGVINGGPVQVSSVDNLATTPFGPILQAANDADQFTCNNTACLSALITLSGADGNNIAQDFVPTFSNADGTYYISKVFFYLKEQGAPTSPTGSTALVGVKLYTSNGNGTPNVLVATSNYYTISQLEGAGNCFDGSGGGLNGLFPAPQCFDFTANAQKFFPVSGTRYVAVLDVSGATLSNSNGLLLAFHTTAANHNGFQVNVFTGAYEDAGHTFGAQVAVSSHNVAYSNNWMDRNEIPGVWKINDVQFSMEQFGSVTTTGTIWVDIYASTCGPGFCTGHNAVPTGPILFESNHMNATNVATLGLTPFMFTFSKPYGPVSLNTNLEFVVNATGLTAGGVAIGAGPRLFDDNLAFNSPDTPGWTADGAKTLGFQVDLAGAQPYNPVFDPNVALYVSEFVVNPGCGPSVLNCQANNATIDISVYMQRNQGQALFVPCTTTNPSNGCVPLGNPQNPAIGVPGWQPAPFINHSCNQASTVYLCDDAENTNSTLLALSLNYTQEGSSPGGPQAISYDCFDLYGHAGDETTTGGCNVGGHLQYTTVFAHNTGRVDQNTTFTAPWLNLNQKYFFGYYTSAGCALNQTLGPGLACGFNPNNIWATAHGMEQGSIGPNCSMTQFLIIFMLTAGLFNGPATNYCTYTYSDNVIPIQALHVISVWAPSSTTSDSSSFIGWLGQLFSNPQGVIGNFCSVVPGICQFGQSAFNAFGQAIVWAVTQMANGFVTMFNAIGSIWGDGQFGTHLLQFLQGAVTTIVLIFTILATLQLAVYNFFFVIVPFMVGNFYTLFVSIALSVWIIALTLFPLLIAFGGIINLPLQTMFFFDYVFGLTAVFFNGLNGFMAWIRFNIWLFTLGFKLFDYAVSKLLWVVRSIKQLIPVAG